MKPIIKIYLLLTGLLLMNINAQEGPEYRENIINKHIDKLVGTWVWTNGNDSFTLVLKKDNVKPVPTADFYMDIFYGFHRYVKNGKEIENTISHQNTLYNHKKWSVFGSGMGMKNHSKEMGISVSSPLKGQRQLHADMEIIDDKHIKIKNFTRGEVVIIYQKGTPRPPLDLSRTLPSNIILTKQ